MERAAVSRTPACHGLPCRLPRRERRQLGDGSRTDTLRTVGPVGDGAIGEALPQRPDDTGAAPRIACDEGHFDEFARLYVCLPDDRDDAVLGAFDYVLPAGGRLQCLDDDAFRDIELRRD